MAVNNSNTNFWVKSSFDIQAYEVGYLNALSGIQGCNNPQTSVTLFIVVAPGIKVSNLDLSASIKNGNLAFNQSSPRGTFTGATFVNESAVFYSSYSGDGSQFPVTFLMDQPRLNTISGQPVIQPYTANPTTEYVVLSVTRNWNQTIPFSMNDYKFDKSGHVAAADDVIPVDILSLLDISSRFQADSTFILQFEHHRLFASRSILLLKPSQSMERLTLLRQRIQRRSHQERHLHHPFSLQNLSERMPYSVRETRVSQ